MIQVQTEKFIEIHSVNITSTNLKMVKRERMAKIGRCFEILVDGFFGAHF